MHDAAVAHCLDLGPEGAQAAQNSVDAAIGDVISINQTEFDRGVSRGFDEVENAKPWVIAMILAAALLAHFGVVRRLNEYRF